MSLIESSGHLGLHILKDDTPQTLPNIRQNAQMTPRTTLGMSPRSQRVFINTLFGIMKVKALTSVSTGGPGNSGGVVQTAVQVSINTPAVYSIPIHQAGIFLAAAISTPARTSARAEKPRKSSRTGHTSAQSTTIRP